MLRSNLSLLSTLFVAAIMFTCPTSLAEEPLPAPFKVIPNPGKVEHLDIPGLKYGQLNAMVMKGIASRPCLGPMLSYLPESSKSGPGILSLERVKDDSVPEANEGYVLRIAEGMVNITSRGEAGLFYGCKTLEQLLEDARDTGEAIPGLKITDAPTLSYRAVHFDTKHHLDTMKYYYDSIDRLARYKINAIVFEFEDKLEYRRQPVVGAPHSIPIDEMAALTRYAAKRHIEISPLVQGLGHATFILKHGEYAHLREDRENNWAFCPLHEGTYQVLFDLYRDAILATPGARYLHVGGDEIGSIGKCERCRGTAEKEGLLALNLYWLNRVCDFATAMGRIPIFWDDMPFKHAGVYHTTHRYDVKEKDVESAWEKGLPILNAMVTRFPKNCVYMRWNYSLARQPGNIRALDWYRDSGLQAMVATAAQNTTALLPQDDRVDIIQSFNGLAAERGIDGTLCTAWDDSSPHMETYWRGFIASAEYSWSPSGRTLEEYETAYLQRAFGPDCVWATNLYAELYKAIQFWRRALMAQGERVYNRKKLMDLPDPAVPGFWSNHHKDRLALAEEEAKRYKRTSSQLSRLLEKTRRNRFQLELLAAINDFQVTAPHLLLALQKSDDASARDRKSGIEGIEKALEEFDRAWKNLQTVYARTRFIAYPKNHVKDRYNHFASQREDLSWLIQVEEEYHALIREWLGK